MPANPIIQTDDIVEFTYKAQNIDEGASVINRQYWRCFQTGTPANETLAACRAAWKSRWEATFGAVLNPSYLGIEVHAKLVGTLVTSGGVRNIVYTAATVQPSSFVGGGTGNPLPGFNTVSIRLRTGFSSRNFRGGIRLGPIDRAQQDVPPNSNKLTTAGFGAWDGAMSSYQADLTIGTTVLRLVVLSLEYWAIVVGGTNPAVGATADVLIGDVNRYIRTQKTREAPHVP